MTCKGEKFGHNFLQGKCLSCGDSQQGLTVSYRGREYEEEKKELSKHKIDHSFQELGIEMSKHFKGNIWWIFNKYPENAIRIAFKKRQEEGVYRIDYLLNDLSK